MTDPSSTGHAPTDVRGLGLALRDPGPVADPAGGVFDRIAVTGVTVRAHHGVFEHERRDGQPFSCDVVLHVDTRAAAAGDDLAATVHYGEVAQDVADVLGGAAVDLLETVARDVADVCLTRTGVRAVDVTVHKPCAPIPVPFHDVTVSVRRFGPLLARPTVGPGGLARPAHAVLALGANLGDTRGALAAATRALADLPDTVLTGISPTARTEPVLAPGQDPQPDYLNAVATVRTLLSPLELLAAAQRVEALAGRDRSGRWGPRVLDVDLVAYDDREVTDATLTLPHPRAHERAFVLAPWSWLDREATLVRDGVPVPVADLLAAVEARGDQRVCRPTDEDTLGRAGTP